MFLNSCQHFTNSEAGEGYVESYACREFSKSSILRASISYVSVDELSRDVFTSAGLP